MTTRRISVEDWVHEPGSGIPEAYLPERNPSTLEASHAFVKDLRQILVGQPVRVLLGSDFSKVNAVIHSACRGYAQPHDIEGLARVALTILAIGGYGVGFYPRGGFSDVALLVVPMPGKEPRDDVSIEMCVRALSGEKVES
jgi:hypothetical protein